MYFRHAGVRNIAVASSKNDKLLALCEEFEECLQKDGSCEQITEIALDVMCSCKGLSGMSILHVSTQFVNKWALPKHYNIIGFTNCKPTSWDERCFEFE
jgi:hypothetical protein